MRRFLITGLPRSRTAWLAVAATHGEVVCHHEPKNNLPSWDAIFDTVWSGGGCVGISDHGLGFYLPEIIRRVAPRTLIVERPIAEVKASLARLGERPTNLCDLLLEALTYQHPLILRVRYSALANTAVVVACLRWLVPGAEIDAARIARLQGENIQADWNRAAELAAGADPAAFIPADVLARLRAS